MNNKITVLFVCSGNTCRSVMAEGLFIKLWEESGRCELMSVSSAGTDTLDGLPASEEALDVLFREGADLSGHRSRKASAKLLEEADYIFTMTRRQRESLQQHYPASAEKVWLLSEYASPGRESDVSDPFAQGLEQYQQVADEIKTSLRAIIERIS